MRYIDAIAREGTRTGDKLNDMLNDSIKQIKVLACFLSFQSYTQDYPERTSRPG